ncbi:MAG: cell division protein FtsZ [Crocinitomicaceae bacterium]|jgi:cell division protein FtsZ|nr:cell division protein FtsZ [Crocinitomicaceae bacterium]
MEFDLPKEVTSIIKVIGVGGGGSNAVNHMYNQGIKGVDFIVCNTDRQALDISPVPLKIQLGPSLTEGLGAGSIPEIGKNAAVENIDDIKDLLSKGTKMVFVTAGMGGGTGTGAAPVIAQVAKELGILTVGIVTVPFNFEGRKRRQQAEEGLEQMRQNVDTLLVINNERLREMSGNLSIGNAFAQADDVVTTAAKGIAEVISVTGIMNVDFKDVNTVMKDSGVAIMGSASAEGESRAIRAVQDAMNSPLLNDNNINGAKYVLLNITYGDKEVLMDEITEITDYIQDEAGSTADVIWGHGHDPSLGDSLCVTLIATGFHSTPITGFEKAPERKVTVLEDEVKSEIVSPMNNPMDKTIAVEAPKAEEPYLKAAAVEIVSKIESPVTPAEATIEPMFDGPVLKSEVQAPSAKEEVKEQASIEFGWEINTPAKEAEVTPESSRIVHSLDDEREVKVELEQSSSKTSVSPEEQQRLAQERMNRIQQYTARLKKIDGINDLEKEPAYVRRNIQLDNSALSSESRVSRFNITTDENGTSLKSNNSFLHDNVD